MERREVETAYDRFADLYDDYVGAFRDDIPFWQSVVDVGATVVEIGCGTGRVMAELVERAASITGVDISMGMLAHARERLAAAIAQGRVELLDHDMTASPLPRPYGVALVTFYTFNYVTEHTDIFLENVFRSLAPGGLLAMDLFCPLAIQQPAQNGVTRTRYLKRDGRSVVLSDTRHLEGTIEVRTQVYTLPLGRRTIVTRRRYHEPAEIERMLSAAGFGDLKFACGYDFTNLAGTERMPRADTSFIVTARRP